MHDALSLDAPARARLFERLRARARAAAPTKLEILCAVCSALLLILSFPDFNLWPLAWVALVPLLLAVVRRRPLPLTAFISGLIAGTLFFFGSCYWLTYAMVRYGQIPAPIAYLLLVPGALVLGLFPAAFCAVLARVCSRWGLRALFLAPFLWAALEWARLLLTGQLWNAIGYSQAYHPALIQAASWGGVYGVSFLILTVNAALAYALLQRSRSAFVTAAVVLILTGLLIFALERSRPQIIASASSGPDAVVVALQPNVPMENALEMTDALVERHLRLSTGALQDWERDGNPAREQSAGVAASERDAGTARPRIPRVVIWPESPMNFQYAKDTRFRELVAGFATSMHTSVLFNSLEPAPANGAYNSAVMVNEEGRVVAQYDKIRLLPFGEYVPLPRWLPGVSLVPVMVGDFTAGAQYPLMPLGEARSGVFICFESAFPEIARRFASEGADVLVNISNDGYLGPTPVMRQHLANAVFRAVENRRPVLRVTNTGITAYITERGEVLDATDGFVPAVRTWTVQRANSDRSFYTKRGDLFAIICGALSLLALAATMRRGN